ncbi:MAG: GAF domain-containing protein [Fimbriimonadaceae bacterium]|nr:GAF domain-containing protein [Fimbriimonadaceae bacterium]
MIVELGVRLGLAVTVVACSLLLKQPAGEIGWQAPTVYSLIALAVFGLDKYKRRNSGVAGFVAVFDALFIATVLSATGQLDRFGFLVLAPMMWATGRYATDAAAMAPLVAASVMVTSNFFGGPGFTLPIMMHTLGILVVGLLTNHSKVIHKETQIPVEVTREIEVESEGSIRMKESYATLKNHVKELEQSTKKERLGMKLWAVANSANENPLTALASKLREEAVVEGVIFYTLDPEERKFVVSSVSGKVPSQARESSLSLAKGLSEAQMRDRLDRQLSELRDPERAVKCASLILKNQGKPCGCIGLFEASPPALMAGIDALKVVTEYLGGLLAQILKKEDESRRLREAEILYGVASVTIGAESQQGLIARVIREVGAVIDVDHLAAFMLDGDSSTMVSSYGATHRVMEDLSFAYGPGQAGWLMTGSPEVIAPDALEDDRIDKTIALKNRIGSFVLLPILNGDQAIGYVTASTNRIAGIDRARLETLRAVVGELGQAVIRQNGGSAIQHGVMTPQEFFASVRDGGAGHFVYFDILNRESLIKEFGQPAIDAAMRKITHRLRGKLPTSGGLCRRDEGDFVAYLSGMTNDNAQAWANDNAAMVNGLRLTTPDGRLKIPMNVRAKVAPFSPQKRQVSQEVAS